MDLGGDSYEITKPVYAGWDEDEGRNSFKIDLSWLTSLKYPDAEAVKKINENDLILDSANVRQYFFKDDNGMFTGKK